ncbi:SA1362 family protein [Salimicrobium sp. PL1-032A]|uniref:SA1362 family protein n=1 Tax=Salimicrobium sp. PL1-032A TaxID=3095364 RepID=UPI003260B11E
MPRQWFTWVIYALFGLAAFYVVSQLFTNTAGFLTSIMVMVAVAAVIYGLIYFVFIRKRVSGGNTNEMRKYKQAVKQSKQKYGSSAPDTSKIQKNTKKPAKKRKSAPPHLRVINGTKGKDKDKDNNRATF